MLKFRGYNVYITSSVMILKCIFISLLGSFDKIRHFLFLLFQEPVALRNINPIPQDLAGLGVYTMRCVLEELADLESSNDSIKSFHLLFTIADLLPQVELWEIT